VTPQSVHAEDGEAQGIPSDIDADVWRIQLTPGVAPGLQELCALCKDLDWAGARLRLSLPEAAVSAWLSASVGYAGLDGLVDPILSVALEELVSQICSAVASGSASGVPRVASPSAPQRPLPHSWTVTAHHETTNTTFYAAIECDALALMLLASLVQRMPAESNGLIDADLPVTLSANLGWSTVQLEDLREIRPLDVLFIDNYLATDEGELWLTAGSYGLRIAMEGTSFRITKGWTAVVNEIPEQIDDLGQGEPKPIENAEETGAAFDLNSVPMRLTFSLGERQITYGELQRLKPGETFDLSRPVSMGPVIIRVNGARLGTGDLVEIDGRVGVTVREVGSLEP
jgi:type III secretion protein Q